jgi:hypothetical protein
METYGSGAVRDESRNRTIDGVELYFANKRV